MNRGAMSFSYWERHYPDLGEQNNFADDTGTMWTISTAIATIPDLVGMGIFKSVAIQMRQ